MLPNKPYLLRAFHQWIVDSACTPILVVDTLNPRCKLPKDYIDGPEIIFNISATAIRDLKITNKLVEFTASFSGVIHLVSAPMNAVLAIYAEENGEGFFFEGNEESDTTDTGTGNAGSADTGNMKKPGGSSSIIPFKSKNSDPQDMLQHSLTEEFAVPPASFTEKTKPVLRLVE